jgi:CheY-like chemotaxis protein/GGDEF domain-containing protein
MKILAVDDDHFTLELLTLMSNRLGFFDLQTATSGDSALDLLINQDVQFDCILIDVEMPDMDGIDLCSHIRDISTYRTTPIIMLTSVTERTVVDRVFKAGATDCANKSFDIVELGIHLHMAQEAVEATQAALAPPNVRRLGSCSRDHSQLRDEALIEGINGVIAYDALRNYMALLSRIGGGGLQIMAAKIKNFDLVSAHASSEALLYILANVAETISELFRPSECMMAYAGSGAFVIVSRFAGRGRTNDLEARLEEQIKLKSGQGGANEAMNIAVSLGTAIRPTTTRAERIRKTFDRAIKRAEKRAASK